MTAPRTRIDSRGLHFSHELRVALWYILEEEFPSAATQWMGGELGGEEQRLLEELVRKDLNKLGLASGATVAEMLRNFVIMLARPHEMMVLLERMITVIESPALSRLSAADRHDRVERVKSRILAKLSDFGLPMTFTEQRQLIYLAVDVGPVTLARLPRAEDLEHRLPPLLSRHPLVSLVFIDVDGLKTLNDRRGHDTGTASLSRLVDTLSHVVVGRGTVFRYGGDEFVVVLPNFDLDEATATAERIRRTIVQAVIGDPPLTVSAGVACSSEGISASALIHNADEAAYASKFGGKNRVTTWPLDPDPARAIAAARKDAQGR